jgi:hypothetical protein
MKFSTRQDIDAPADFVFAQLTDFEALERQAMRRGIEVERKSYSQPRGIGAGWTIQVPFRGKTRDVTAEITEFDASNALTANAVSGGVDMLLEIELVPLSNNRTRVSFGYDVRPQTLPARLLVQSVKFAKSSLQRRYERRIGKFADLIAERYEAQARA